MAASVRTEMGVVLFADLTASTALLTRIGDARFEALRRALVEEFGRVVDANAGAILKDLGDGAMATFAGAAGGLRAASELQAAAERAGRSCGIDDVIEVRVGLSAGDITFDDGDVHGTPVVEASRLCSVAAPRQALASDLVVLLARGHLDGLTVRSIGEVELKGFTVPVSAHVVGTGDRCRAGAVSARTRGSATKCVCRSRRGPSRVGSIDGGGRWPQARAGLG